MDARWNPTRPLTPMPHSTRDTQLIQTMSGQARVWFYRPWEPSESLDLALIDMNGSYVGAVANGSAFFRDVPPGHYHIAPESFGRDFNQDRNVDLSPGQQTLARIRSGAANVSRSTT
jgi:hypothetical protein